MLSANQYFQSFNQKLSAVYDADEARAITGYITGELLMIKYHQLNMIDRSLGDDEVKYFDGVLLRLLKHEPLQYILGYEWFCGLKFIVNDQVLIPRPETEELTDLLIAHCREHNLKQPVIIDLGTGSGCIPVALKKNIPGATVYGLDVMEGALNVAKENARINKVDVTFFKDDMLDPAFLKDHGPFDFIISNPPYIALEEETQMEPHVKSYEPHSALFSAGDPLTFYKAIRKIAEQHLTATGSTWLEINPLFAEETLALFANENVQPATIINDMSGKKRFVVSHA